MPDPEKPSIFATLLRDRLESVGLKPHGLAVDAGISPSNLYNILSGKRSPSENEIEKLAAVDKLKVPPDILRAWADADKLGEERVQNLWWLLFMTVSNESGSGEIDLGKRGLDIFSKNAGCKNWDWIDTWAKKHDQDHMQINITPRLIDEYLKHSGKSKGSGRKTTKGNVAAYMVGLETTVEPITKKIPLAGAVGCGRKLDLEPTDTIELPVDVARRGDYAVKAEGDSMNRLIADGDILIIRSQRTAKEGQVVVANIHHDGSTCKRFRRFGKTAMLMPESYNTEHQPEPLTEDISIIGVVTYVHRPGIALE